VAALHQPQSLLLVALVVEIVLQAVPPSLDFLGSFITFGNFRREFTTLLWTRCTDA
jgi:hypothetical protein